ncbi:MAG: PadR family transcriptional regulator [Candidatus Methanoplasma sp.]|jgi:DNA-binding PadR family transcriptional regulator|nr:PadR family transcriptional regulator [Candidatus Methanoplasma sp.]
MMGLPNLNYNGSRVSPVQLMVLLSVRKEKKYGYEIIKDLREIFEGVWEPKTGVIYPVIKKLQETGMLTSEIIEDKEYYSVSAGGMEWLIEAFPALGAMSSVGIRFLTALAEAGEDLGIRPKDLTDPDELSKDDKLRMLLETRNVLEKDLMKLNEMIEKMAGGNCEQHN